MQEIKECRICLDSEESSKLFSPCLCKGSNAYIHEHCLFSLRQMNDNHSKICPTCKYEYIITKPFIAKYLIKEEGIIFLSLIISSIIVIIIAIVLKIFFITRGKKSKESNCINSAILFISCLVCHPLLLLNADPMMNGFLAKNGFLYFLYLNYQFTTKFIVKNLKFKEKVHPYR